MQRYKRVENKQVESEASPKSNKKKKTKIWCKGKVGITHNPKWVKVQSYFGTFRWDNKCQRCGKIKGSWYPNSKYWPQPKPEGIPDE